MTALAENPKQHDIINALRQQFAPIHTEWLAENQKQDHPDDTVLHDDIIALGLFIIAHDKIAARLDKKLLAELLSFLTPSLQQMPYEYTLTALDDQIEKLSAAYNTAQEWPTLASLDLAKSWAGTDARRRVQAQALVDLFAKLANEFVLVDGKVSNDEIRFLNGFDKHFAIA